MVRRSIAGLSVVILALSVGAGPAEAQWWKGWLDRLSDGKRKAADYALQDALVQGPGPGGDHQVLVTNRLGRKQRSRIEGFDGTLLFERG